MTQRNVLLTFDYELFFRQSGTPERCLLEPTDVLLAQLAAAGARATFFVDAAYLMRILEEPRAAEDARRVVDQIARAVAAGHRAELQMHPHWLDAVWIGHGRWEFPTYRYYRIQALSETRSVDLVVSATEALCEAVREAQGDYTVQAYRAGGFCAQPFAFIAAGMQAAGLTIDSSVAAGTVANTKTHYFDYRTVPDGPCWRFDDDPLVPVADGRLTEIPVSCIRVGPWTRTRRRLEMLADPHAFHGLGDGTYMPGYDTLLGKILPSNTLLALESTSPALLRSLLSRADSTVTMIGHPKSLARVSMDSIRALAEDGVRFMLPAELVAETDAAMGRD